MLVTHDDGEHDYEAAGALPARWNGALQPLFTRETALTILDDALTTDAGIVGVLWTTDTVTVIYADRNAEVYTATPSGRYPIGAGSWAWMAS